MRCATVLIIQSDFPLSTNVYVGLSHSKLESHHFSFFALQQLHIHLYMYAFDIFSMGIGEVEGKYEGMTEMSWKRETIQKHLYTIKVICLTGVKIKTL